MAQLRDHLAHAPIVEALIDVRVLPRPDASMQVLHDLAQGLNATYPDLKPMRSVEAHLNFKDGQVGVTGNVAREQGWRVKNEQRGAVAQFAIDRFTFNQLEPYTRWESVSREALALWRLYADAMRPIEVTRLAVRYINRLRIPVGSGLEEYLEAPPSVPREIPQTIREFLSRTVVSDPARNASVIITQALEAPLDQRSLQILLDIDAFAETTMPPDDASIPGIFNQLRELKNIVFFASVTEKTVEMYK